MADFKLKIAGQTAQVHSLFESTRDYCRSYLTEDAAHFSITVTAEDLEFEQRDALDEARREGFRPRIFTDPFLERAAIQRAFAEHLLSCGTLMLHGSAIAVDGTGYLFTAKSGTGKSTHTRLWREVFGDRAVMINDDKPFVQIGESSVLICGAPWSGKHGLDANVTVPLKGVCILSRGPENKIRHIGPGDVMAMLLHQSYAPSDSRKTAQYQALVALLANRVPLWHMECTRDPQAARTAFGAMSGEEI